MRRITVWEPGERPTFLYRDTGGQIDDTEVDIRFEPVESGTRVTLEHRAWDTLPNDIARRRRAGKQYGWTNILLWFSEWSFWGSPRRVGTAVSAGQGCLSLPQDRDSPAHLANRMNAGVG